MASEPPLFLVLDLAGTFAFALNGALTAVRAVRLDIVGVVTLGMVTALGGGTVRDVLLDALPPATFIDLRYLAVAAIGALVAFGLSFRLERLAMPITVLDGIGLSVFAVLGGAQGAGTGFRGGAVGNRRGDYRRRRRDDPRCCDRTDPDGTAQRVVRDSGFDRSGRCRCGARCRS